MPTFIGGTVEWPAARAKSLKPHVSMDKSFSEVIKDHLIKAVVDRSNSGKSLKLIPYLLSSVVILDIFVAGKTLGLLWAINPASQTDFRSFGSPM